MTAQKTMEQVSGETGISIRVLLGLLALVISASLTLGATLAGVGVKGVIGFTKMQGAIEALEEKIDASSDALREEIARDRWTSRDAARLQAANQRALNDAGIDVQLPDTWTVQGK